MNNLNILEIKQRIDSACRKSGRRPDEITLIAVVKNRPVGSASQAVAQGVIDLGENRVQEAVIKYSQISGARWHLIGHLQTNKVKDAVRIFDLIHSVDSLRLAREIDKQAVKLNKIQDVLIEIKTSPEESKFGIEPDKGIEMVKLISGLKNIRIKGLMTIAPLADAPEQSRPYFRRLRELKDIINADSAASFQLSTLSMGMSDDFEIAIEEGSTMVRIGRALFDS